MPRSNVQCSMDFGWLVWHPWIFLFGNMDLYSDSNLIVIWYQIQDVCWLQFTKICRGNRGGSSLYRSLLRDVPPTSPNSKSKQLLQVTTIHMSHPHRSDLICCDVRNVGIAYSNPWEWSSGDRGFQRFGCTAPTRNLCSIGWVIITVIGYKNMMVIYRCFSNKGLPYPLFLENIYRWLRVSVKAWKLHRKYHFGIKQCQGFTTEKADHSALDRFCCVFSCCTKCKVRYPNISFLHLRFWDIGLRNKEWKEPSASLVATGFFIFRGRSVFANQILTFRKLPF